MSQFNMRHYGLHTVYLRDAEPMSFLYDEDSEDDFPYFNFWYDEMGVHYTSRSDGLRHHIPTWRIVEVTTKD